MSQELDTRLTIAKPIVPYAVNITRKNIDSYRTGVFYSKRINWGTHLDARVLQNFPDLEYICCLYVGLTSLEALKACPKLTELACSHNKLRSLEGIEHCPLLWRLDCGHNRLTTLRGLEGCPQLQQMDCSYNELRSLEGLDRCTKLVVLVCRTNKLISVNGIGNCAQLRYLDLTKNRLGSLKELGMHEQLYRLKCNENGLTSLIGVEGCRQLRILDCSSNKLGSLEGIEHCLYLTELSCSFNEITSLEPVVYLRHLRTIYFSINPLDVQSIQVQRRLGMITRVNTNRSVYSDSQSVHNIHIQKCVCESVQRLIRDPEPKFSIEMVIESGMDERAIRLLLEYCSDESVHSQHLLSLRELLSYVWARICRSEHKVELVKILAEQICDSECKCFTGRFNRILSVLVGFYPDIVIAISDNSRIGAIILAVKEQIDPYDAVQHRALAHKQLLEAGYQEAEIEPWLEAITEP